MILLRRVIGDALRARRQSQHRTLREVSTAANVSLGYLSEIERGQKEASSELLAAICDALGAQLSELLREVSQTVEVAENHTTPVRPSAPAIVGPVRRGIGHPVSGRARDAMPVGVQRTRAELAAARFGAAESTEPVDAREPADAAATGRSSIANLPSDGAKLPVPSAIMLPKAAVARTARHLAVDGDVSVSIRQDSPLKATLRAKRNIRSTNGRGRDPVSV
jgi:XRE family transcriptional regulator, stress-response regulator